MHDYRDLNYLIDEKSNTNQFLVEAPICYFQRVFVFDEK